MPIWIEVTHWGARLILLLLLGLSVWSVSIMLESFKSFRFSENFTDIEKAEKLIREKNWNELKSWVQSSQGLHVGTLRAAIESGSVDPDLIDRSVRSYLTLEKARLENGLTPLATLGSNAPFIGLFGTVLGIIQAFAVLGSSHADTTSIMVGISEALVATAVGLFVAIPAVIAYNYFSRKMKLILVRCESLKDLYLSRLG